MFIIQLAQFYDYFFSNHYQQRPKIPGGLPKTSKPMTTVFLTVLLFGVIFLSGCASHIKPEMGAIAQPEARIELLAAGVQNAAWAHRDVSLAYSYTESAGVLNFSGTLRFDRSLTDSFGIVKSFSLKMSFLDKDGRVLQTTDITPLYRYLGAVPDELAVRASIAKPAEASGIAFNYFGIFKSGGKDETGGDTWDIFYFPFN